MDEAERCTKAAYIYYGRLLVSGDPNSMKREEIAHTHRRIEIVCEPLMPAMAALRDAPYVDDVSVFGQALHIRLRDVPPEPLGAEQFASFASAARRAAVRNVLRQALLAAGINVAENQVHSVYPTLEDIFVTLHAADGHQPGGPRARVRAALHRPAGRPRRDPLRPRRDHLPPGGQRRADSSSPRASVGLSIAVEGTSGSSPCSAPASSSASCRC